MQAFSLLVAEVEELDVDCQPQNQHPEDRWDAHLDRKATDCQRSQEQHPDEQHLVFEWNRSQAGGLGQQITSHQGWVAGLVARVAAWASLSRPARCSTVVICSMLSTE